MGRELDALGEPIVMDGPTALISGSLLAAVGFGAPCAADHLIREAASRDRGDSDSTVRLFETEVFGIHPLCTPGKGLDLF
jgi:hypothetical protein